MCVSGCGERHLVVDGVERVLRELLCRLHLGVPGGPAGVRLPAAEASNCDTVKAVAPPKAEEVFSKMEQVEMFLQTLVRSMATPPDGPGAPILLPPSAPSLKYVSSAVASICAFSKGFIEL